MSESSTEHYWPRHRRPDREDSVFVACGECERCWQVHRDLIGFQFDCDCGNVVGVPIPRVLLEAPDSGSPQVTSAFAPQPAQEDRQFDLIEAQEPTLLAPVAEADGPERNPYTTRTILELSAIVFAFLAPHVVMHFLVTGDEAALYTPFCSLLASGLILGICFTSLADSLGGLKRTGGRFFVEAVVVAGLAFLGATGWMELLSSVLDNVEDPTVGLVNELGLAMSIFSVAVIPAVFEEIAFRGLLHARLRALLGPAQGLLVTSAAFALAHGVTFGLPFHMGLGLYLGLLRERSGSLLPGMVLHFLYNGALLVAA